MSTDWFSDNGESSGHREGQSAASWVDAEVSVELPDAEEADSAQKRSPRAGGKSDHTRWWGVGGVGLLVACVIGGAGVLWWAGHSSPHDDAAAIEQESAAPSSESASSTAASPACEQVEADPRDLQGVVVAFQQAYYAGDAEAVERLLSPESALQETDWEQVLEVVGDTGSDVCAVTRVVEDGVVAADVTVYGKAATQVYLQEYHLNKAGDLFQIMEIADRSKK
ncbi:hypothetical protein ACUY2L_04010 [Corynebacterium mastitidis]